MVYDGYSEYLSHMFGGYLGVYQTSESISRMLRKKSQSSTPESPGDDVANWNPHQVVDHWIVLPSQLFDPFIGLAPTITW